MISKKRLEIILSNLKENPKPKLSLEQYTISGVLASEILNLVYLSGDIKNKEIADLGCGTGRLAIGCVLLGAKKVIGIDIDKNVLKIAKENVKLAEKITKKKIKDKIKFVHSDISKWKKRVDVIIQNPPFGFQTLHADRIFLKKALECSKKIYSLHRSYEKTRKFIKKFVDDNNGKVKNVIKYKFRIPYMFKFHKKRYVEYDVDLFIIEVD